MKKFIFIFLAAISLSSSCRNEPQIIEPTVPTLPPITQTGENTFGCLVDGEVWLPKGGGILFAYDVTYSNGYFQVYVNQSSDVGFQTVQMSLFPVNRDTVVEIQNSSLPNDLKFFRFGDATVSPAGYYDAIGGQYTGVLNISKLDSINHILSGTFWFDAIDTTTNKTVQIREGRFDVRY
jgi:hypothetical protein